MVGNAFFIPRHDVFWLLTVMVAYLNDKLLTIISVSPNIKGAFLVFSIA